MATNDHHLRLFFSELTDPAWLEPLHQAGIAQLPGPEGPWPVIGLLDGLARTIPEAVAALLERLLADVNKRPKDDRSALRFELLRTAVQIGPPGHKVVAEVARLHSDLMHVRSLSVHAAQSADPTAPVVRQVADAVLSHFRRFSDGDSYHATEVLDQLQKGVTADNVADRARMLAGKTRKLTRTDLARYARLGREALTVEPDDHPDPLLLFAHHLARILSKSRRWDVPTSVQLDWLGAIQGDVGGRLRGHVLAGAEDVAMADKIAHITSRLTSSTPAAEDLAVVTDILSHHPMPEELAVWTDALGTPPPAPSRSEDPVPHDSVRVWRWSGALPGYVLAAWRDVIDQVTERYGQPDSQALTRTQRPLQWETQWGQSPYSAEQLSALSPRQAAELVAAWEPDADSQWQMHDPLELARALAEVVKAEPVPWCADPPSVVAALREPLYIEYYFRGLTERAADIVPHAPTVLATALAHLRATRNPPHDHISSENQQNWVDIEDAVLDLARALAGKDADLNANLNDLWQVALAATFSAPNGEDDTTDARRDPLNNAINRPWGHGFQTVFALAAWEFRNIGSIRPEFEHTLDAVTATPGTTGLELRALLAHRRPLLEGIAKPWLDTHATVLFREGPLAQETFDLTVQWARPTPWLYQNFKSELLNAALRGADHAVRQIAVAILNEVDGYAPEPLIKQLSKDPIVLASATNDVAFLVQGTAPDSPQLTAAIQFWRLLLDTDRAHAPAQALTSLGRWAFVDNIDDDQWARLTTRTLDATNGQIDNIISVADRAARIPPSNTTRGLLLRLLNHGDPWERQHTATKAIDVLHATPLADDSFHRLRTRLIDLGYHEATDIDPPGNTA